MNRKYLYLIVCSIVGISLVFIYKKIDSVPKDFQIKLTPTVISADGNSSALLECKILSRFGRAMRREELDSPPIINIVQGEKLVRVIYLDSLNLRLVANFEQGEVVIRAKHQDFIFQAEATLRLVPSLAENFGNNNSYPREFILDDEADKNNFRNWFCEIVKLQYKRFDAQWKQHDCAGLIRYAYCEALKKHDSKWISARQEIENKNFDDVKKYNYPSLKNLGTKVFKIDCRDTEENDKNILKWNQNCFAEFAEAGRMKDNMLIFLSRNKQVAKPADIIFYLNDYNPKTPYHTMVYIGNDEVIYHNGGEGEEGIIKKLTLTQLQKHPNKLWHPVEDNPNFLGFYRWAIL